MNHPIALASLCAAMLAGCAAPPPLVAPQASALVGAWRVDLRAKPDAPAYFQELVVTQVQGRTFTGRFYGSPISQGRLNTDWDAVRIAFVTEDGSGPYHHSGVLVGTRIEGLTNSIGRDFLSYWSATKP